MLLKGKGAGESFRLGEEEEKKGEENLLKKKMADIIVDQ